MISGAITNRIDRLENRGWVLRESDPHNRAVLVSLTPAGFEQANHVIALNNRTEERLFGSVDRTVIQRLNDDLRAYRIDGATGRTDQSGHLIDQTPEWATPAPLVARLSWPDAPAARWRQATAASVAWIRSALRLSPVAPRLIRFMT